MVAFENCKFHFSQIIYGYLRLKKILCARNNNDSAFSLKGATSLEIKQKKLFCHFTVEVYSQLDKG